jgi:hypothetical protein
MQPTTGIGSGAPRAEKTSQGENGQSKDNVAAAKTFHSILTKVMDAANENANNQ